MRLQQCFSDEIGCQMNGFVLPISLGATPWTATCYGEDSETDDNTVSTSRINAANTAGAVAGPICEFSHSFFSHYLLFQLAL
jgi:hypothetical protein